MPLEVSRRDRIRNSWTVSELPLSAFVSLSSGRYFESLPQFFQVARFGQLRSGVITVRVFRAQDVSSEGVVSGSPYFGVVSQNLYRDKHGPIMTARFSWPVPVWAADPLETIGSGPRTILRGQSNVVPNPATIAYSWEIDTRPGAWAPQIITGFTPSPTSITTFGGQRWMTMVNAGTQTIPNRWWSEYPCNGSWVLEIQESFILYYYLSTSQSSFRYRRSVTSLDDWWYLGSGARQSVTFTTRRTLAFTIPGTYRFGNSGFTWSSRPCPTGRPVAPTVSATATQDDEATVTWTMVRDIAVSYWEISTDNTNWTRVDGTTFTFTGLTGGTSYTFYVRGVGPSGTGEAGRASVTTPATSTVRTVAPTVSVADLEQVSATINWIGGVGGIPVNEWQWSTDNTTWTDVPGGAGVFSLAVENLSPNTAYTYYIRGVSTADLPGRAGSVSFTTPPLELIPQNPVVGGAVVGQASPGTLGGGTLVTTFRPALVVVRGQRPVVSWNQSAFVVDDPTIYDGAQIPGSEDGRLYADEFEALPLRWTYFSQFNRAQESVNVTQEVYDADGDRQSAGQRTLQVVNNVATFTATATTVDTELNAFSVAGNTAGTNAASITSPNGWGATPDGNDLGFSRIGLFLTATDDGDPPRTSSSALMELVPYQGLRLGAISTYTAGANILGFECHYYAKGITANTQARNNEVAFYKWAVYRRGAPETERPLAGTIREAGQTLAVTGAHWVPTGWKMGYRLYAWQNPVSQRTLTVAAVRNPNTTRLRVAFPSSSTTGLLPNGNYTLRLRVMDIYGNQVGPVSFDFTVNRPGAVATPVRTALPSGSDPEAVAVTTAPRVYDRNFRVVGGFSGLLPGASIGLSATPIGTTPNVSDYVRTGGEGGYIVFERREYSRQDGGDVDRIPRIISARIRPSGVTGSAGAWTPQWRSTDDVTYTGGGVRVWFDQFVTSGVQYEYRVVSVNRYGNRVYSTWVPA